MTDELHDDAIVVASDEPLTTELEDELVILDGDSSTYYGLNEVGRRIWELIEEPRTIADVRDQLVTEYDAEPDRCDRDVRELVEDLSSKGLVDVREEQTE